MRGPSRPTSSTARRSAKSSAYSASSARSALHRGSRGRSSPTASLALRDAPLQLAEMIARVVPARERRQASCHARVPGAAHPRQPRTRRARERARPALGRLAPGGPPRRHQLPLARGPPRQAVHAPPFPGRPDVRGPAATCRHTRGRSCASSGQAPCRPRRRNAPAIRAHAAPDCGSPNASAGSSPMTARRLWAVALPVLWSRCSASAAGVIYARYQARVLFVGSKSSTPSATRSRWTGAGCSSSRAPGPRTPSSSASPMRNCR